MRNRGELGSTKPATKCLRNGPVAEQADDSVPRCRHPGCWKVFLWGEGGGGSGHLGSRRPPVVVVVVVVSVLLLRQYGVLAGEQEQRLQATTALVGCETLSLIAAAIGMAGKGSGVQWGRGGRGGGADCRQQPVPVGSLAAI